MCSIFPLVYGRSIFKAYRQNSLDRRELLSLNLELEVQILALQGCGFLLRPFFWGWRW